MLHSNHIPYYSLSDYYKEKYGEKVYKIAIDGGFTCPNRDGSLHSKGCIFCSQDGSGSFAASRDLDMAGRVQAGKDLIKVKSKAQKFIVYFQAFTNTYDELASLRKIYTSALIDDSVVGLSIATRPDCLSQAVIELLKELSYITDIYVELGLQSIHPKTASFIRRGYDLSVYDEAVLALQKANIPLITHIILGLPNETYDDMLATLKYVCNQNISGIKLQLLHILTDTDLYTYYQSHPFPIFTEIEYVETLVKLIESIPKDIVIHRMTGDGPKDLLFEPKWSLHKRHVLNLITQEFKRKKTYQGKLCIKTEKENYNGQS
jgi:radical SAM protein (TIGR01212 family)